MRKRMFEFQCPHCKNCFSSVKDTYLLADPGSKEEVHIQDGTYFVHQCQSCRKLFTLSYPVQYRNPEKHFTIWLSDRSDLESEGDLTLITRNSEDFLFAVNVLNAGLDPVLVLRIKKHLEKDAGQVRFSDYDPETHTIWFLKNGQLCAVLYPPIR